MDPKLMSFDDKIAYLNQMVAETFKTIGVDTAVVHIKLDLEQPEFILLRWPQCHADCKSQDLCSVAMFDYAMRDMQQQIEDLMQGTSIEVNKRVEFKS